MLFGSANTLTDIGDQILFKINDKLAVHGFDWDWSKMTDRNINNHEYPEDNYGVVTDPQFDRTGRKTWMRHEWWIVVDCRVLLDDVVNPIDKYKTLIESAINFLNQGNKVICCCSAGQSRSNSIALGVLIEYFGMDFYDAWDLLREKNPFCGIAMEHLGAIKTIYNVTLP